ncbi:hypothetical protein AAF712_002894 [Marasmius tenuissimus]|uniref:Cytochrome P450 n=1 Tax=Marasmius tenuissimus TaxID=585030 RepID=A0ABR3A9E5_9AGAR
MIIPLLVISFLIATGIRRVFLHPLSKFPGPKLAALSTWYQAYFDIVKNGGFLKHLHELHAAYGPVVRIGPNHLHFCTADGYHDIYNVPTYAKSISLYRAFPPPRTTSFTFTDIAKARERRAVLNPLFSRRSILKLERFLQKRVDTFISRVLSQKEPFYMDQAVRSLTTDIITTYCFAKCFNTIDDPDFCHPITLAQRDFFAGLWITKHFPLLVYVPFLLPKWLAKKLIPGFVTYRERLIEPLARQVEKYITDRDELMKAEHDTIFHHLLAHRDKSGAEMSKKTLLNEAVIVIGAGEDTVANACTVAIANALRNPEIHRKLVDELREAWPDMNMEFGYTALEKLPYLTAFIKETLRCSHGVVSPLPRVVGPGDGRIDGYDIPRGTIVATSAVFLHQNPEVFENPKEFRPERWFESNAREIESRYLVAFSRGPRVW